MAKKKDLTTKRTTLIINDWSQEEKSDDDTEMLFEHIFNQIKEGFTSGHEDQIYWSLRVEEVK
jgi:hypothetical protein